MSSLLSRCQMHYILLEYDVWHATKDHKSFLIFQIAENRYKISYCLGETHKIGVCVLILAQIHMRTIDLTTSQIHACVCFHDASLLLIEIFVSIS